jgi:hypothetical protein
VLSWGRADAQAELFSLIEQAITTSSSSRSTDQQNAVAWVQAVEQREAEQAAQDAGLEYVKWAGLDQGTYGSDVATNATESDLQSFLSGTPEPYNNDGSGGYCIYQSPAPYQSEYTANIFTPLSQSTASPTCFGSGGIGSLFGGPPTPSYDQFTKWGEADEVYSLQSSGQTVQASAAIAAGLDFGAAAVGAGVAGATLSSGLASALVGSALQEAIFPYAARVGYGLIEQLGEEAADVAVEASAAGEIASAAGAIAGAVIFAITTAVIEGINVANAAALPGQLAALIVNARTTAPDPASLLNDANGASSLFTLFVGATLPAPTDQTCDNSSPIPPGVTVISGSIIAGSFPPCLNPTAVPPATSTDLQFVVQQKGGTLSSTTSSITWQDAVASATMTARLSGNWFVVQAGGTATEAQTLSIPYTDWNGNEQVAWLVSATTPRPVPPRRSTPRPAWPTVPAGPAPLLTMSAATGRTIQPKCRALGLGPSWGRCRVTTPRASPSGSPRSRGARWSSSPTPSGR